MRFSKRKNFQDKNINLHFKFVKNFNMSFHNKFVISNRNVLSVYCVKVFGKLFKIKLAKYAI